MIYSNTVNDTITFGAFLEDKNLVVAAEDSIEFVAGNGPGSDANPFLLRINSN